MDSDLHSYMSPNLIVVRWDEAIDHAYGLMQAHELRHLPVVSDRKEIIGLISDRDFQRAMHFGPNPTFENRFLNLGFDPDSKVFEFMSWPVEMIDDHHSIAEAAQVMLEKKISSLVVTRDGRAVGILTTEDLLRALIGAGHGQVERIRGEVQGAVYSSPIGPIAHVLANAGI